MTPEIKRIMVKLVASASCSPNASRHKIELPAKASNANVVKEKVLMNGVCIKQLKAISEKRLYHTIFHHMSTESACPHNPTISCNDCRLSSLCLPLGFTRSELTEIDEMIKQRPLLQKGDVLYRTSDLFEHIYVIRSGCIKTAILTPQGEEKITGFYLPGDIIGMDGIDNEHYSNSATALDTTSVCKIPFDQIEVLATQLPSLQRHMFTIMSREIVSDQQTMLILNKNKAEARICAFLISLSNRFQRQNLSATRWTLPMSRGDLANYLGLTIESVSRVFTKLRNLQVISIDKRDITINNIDHLQAAANMQDM